MTTDETLAETPAQEPPNECSPTILKAQHVYLLMKKEYRISRNARAQWFFSNLNGILKVDKKSCIEEYEEEIGVLSVIPVDPPPDWDSNSAANFQYKVLPTTTVTFLARRYRLVFCLDLSPSVMTVDAFYGEVMYDRMVLSLRKCLEAVTKEFTIPGSVLKFCPQLYITIIAHTSSFIIPNQLVLVQGWLLTTKNVQSFLEVLSDKLNAVEDCLAKNARSRITKTNGNRHPVGIRQSSFDRYPNYSYDMDMEIGSNGSSREMSGSYPDTSFVDLIRYGILALQLLPDNSSAGIIVVTDGIISVPDVNIFQSLLAQLRNSTISCSFLDVSSSENPSCCWGYSSFPDLMKFIAVATYGAYIPQTAEHGDDLKLGVEMNVYHQAFLCWSFQWDPYVLKTNLIECQNGRFGSRLSYSGLRFSPTQDIQVERKLQTEKSISTSLSTLIFCRLREGYCIRHVVFPDSDHIEVTLLLPWKQDVSIIYSATSAWPLESSSCRYKVIIEGSYEFLHDWTCTTKKPIKSIFRCNVVKKFYETLQSLSQTDAILSHLHSFAANPAFYTIPDSVRNGVPLFYLPPGSNHPVICSGDMLCTKFPEFWQPICILDINIWQKWMHTHRIGILLTHDQPLPKHLHLPNSSDRYHTVQCRQALTALNTLLADWSSFVLVENHSYIKFMFGEPDKPPIYFYIIRVTFKAPCMVIRLAFLGGTPSHERHKIVAQLREKILSITCHYRPLMKEPVPRKNGRDRHSTALPGSRETISAKPSQDTRCCKQLKKPVEKILIRYERTPTDYANRIQRLMPSHRYSPLNLPQRKTISMFSTLGCYLHHQRWVWMAQSNRSSPISLKSLERVLGTLVKIRLGKGFHFAHSNSGMINMVFEVGIKIPNMHHKSSSHVDEKRGDGETYPCVIQYVMFPPHSTAKVRDSFSEEEMESESGDTADLEGELQMITECWLEPQHGNVIKSGDGSGYLDGLNYKELPQALFNLDLECVSTMLTFEHLSLMCQNSKISTPEFSPGIQHYVQNPLNTDAADPVTGHSIHLVPFPFDLMKLLPKCQQAELVFSTLAQESDISNTLCGDEGLSNILLLKLLHLGIAAIHDREVSLSKVEQQTFPHLVQKRKPGHFNRDARLKSPDLRPIRPNDPSLNDADDSFCRWRCYLKGISETHILLTFVPATYEDVVFMNAQERWSYGASGGLSCEKNISPDLDCDWDETSTSLLEDTHSDIDGLHQQTAVNSRSTLSIYSYDCSLAALIDQTVGGRDASPYSDVYKDYRTLVEIGEETATIRSSEGSKYDSPEPRNEENEASSSGRVHWIQHLNVVATTFSNCFVSTIYQSLQKKSSISYHDIQYAMEDICVETVQEIDITKFLQTVCTLSSSWSPLVTEKTSSAEHQTEALRSEEGTPVQQYDAPLCHTSKKVQELILAKFSAIIRRGFIPVASNPDYFCYSPCRLNRMKSKSRGTEEWSDMEGDDDQETVEFKADDEKLGLSSADNYFILANPAASQGDSSAPSSFSEDLCAYDVDGDDDEDIPPLFVHLICSVHHQKEVYNFPVRLIPTCYETIINSSSLLNDFPIHAIDPNSLRITLDVMCLTLPPEIENNLQPEDSNLRTTSFCSSSPVPQESIIDSKEADGYPMLDDMEVESPKEFLTYLAKSQQQAVIKCVAEIKWMILDEQASFARRALPITEDVLRHVTDHVLNSVGHSGCGLRQIALRFVFGADQSMDKFVHEFSRMNIPGYQLIHEGSYYYLATRHSTSTNTSSNIADRASSAPSGGFAGKHLIVQSHPHQDDAAELGTYLESKSNERRVSGSHVTRRKLSTRISVDATSTSPRDKDNPTEIEVPNQGKVKDEPRQRPAMQPDSEATTSEGGQKEEPLRAVDRLTKKRDAHQTRNSSSFHRSQSRSGGGSEVSPSTFGEEASLLSLSKDYDRGSSSTEDETRTTSQKGATGGDQESCSSSSLPRSIPYGKRRKRSLNLGSSGASGVAIVRHELEDGYDGDSSDVDNDQDFSTELEVRSLLLPNFWLIFRISNETMDVISQYRDAELDEAQLKSHRAIIQQCIAHIKNVCRLVNQALLLQELHDTHMCNQLLEPEANEDIWRTDDPAAGNVSKRLSAHRRYSMEDQDPSVDCQHNYLEATMKLMPGAFSCPIVWETQFVLHPRLKTGIGRTASKGVQAMKAVLSRLSVNNRKNMFVYKERNGGAVFYLRLHETQVLNMQYVAEMSSLSMRPSVTDDGTSLVGSRSSSLQSLNSLGQEPRSRVNSMPEKDRDHGQDTISMSSRLSIGRLRSAEDAITLSVYGITDAGPDIKEDLVKALQNRLDDAVLELISITLARNPMCKLTPEDVQFIQRPEEPPERLVHFTIQAQLLPFLQVIVYYLQQNLMQFLNIPKYNDNRHEYHFQRFQLQPMPVGDNAARPVQDTSSAFLFIRPQEASNRGIACIILAVVNGQGNQVQYQDCPLPSPDSYKDELSPHDFETLTSTGVHQSATGTPSKSPGPVALIQFQIWAKGKVDMDQLVDKLQTAIRHAMWDLVMEYRLLTAPVAEMPLTDDSVGICSEPSTPLKCFPKKKQTLPLVSGDGLRAKDRASSPLFLVQPISPPPMPPAGPGLRIGAKDEEVHLAIDAEVLRRQEKYELGEKGVLHSVYSKVASEWLDYGKLIGVQSVQKQTLSLTSRYSVELLLKDLQALISSLMSDTTPKIFKKEDEYVPLSHHPNIREKKKLCATVSMDCSRPTTPLPGKINHYITVGRNVRQWRVSSGRLDKDGAAEIAEYIESNMKMYKDYQRFPPLLHVGDNSEKLSGAGGLSPQPMKGNTMSPFETEGGSFFFIPRQRLVLIIVRDCQVVLYTYNWTPDVTNSFMERAGKLVADSNTRSCLLTSIILQKLGLFVNQPSMRKPECQKPQGADQKLGAVEVDILIKGNRLLHRREGGVFAPPHQRRGNPSSPASNVPFPDVLRDSWPLRPMHSSPYAHCSDPVFQHGTQFQEIRNNDTRDKQSQIVTICRERETRTSMPVQLLKQISRIEHYCFTPLLFHPLWRLQVASARDYSFPNIFPIVGKMGLLPQPIVEQTSSILGLRSRHSSGTALTSDSRRARRLSAGATLGSATSSSAQYAIKNAETEEWHKSMCNMYVDEFVQYLQTLGFVISSQIAHGRPQQKREQKSKSDLPPTCEENSNSTGSCGQYKPQYMHKSLLGGIILLELGVCEPYFGVKMYTLEYIRFRTLSSRTYSPQFVLTFTDECDKVKVSMHLHSFTYDYHLRSIHSYISGRQMPLRQGYHAVGFLDDFLKYYQKSPNFARNLVHEGEISISASNASQLFDYLLRNDHLYNMRAIKMVGLEDIQEKECVLVQMSTQKVTYRDSTDTKQVDEFDVSLLVARELPRPAYSTDFAVDHLVGGQPTTSTQPTTGPQPIASSTVKYFIILTSCREIFPKPVVEKQPGTFRAVITVAVPPSRPPTPPSTFTSQASPLQTVERQLSTSTEAAVVAAATAVVPQTTNAGTPQRRTSMNSSLGSTPGVPPMLIERSQEIRPGDLSSGELTDSGTFGSTYEGGMLDVLTRSVKLVQAGSGTAGIKQEVVNYMGYFSTHEELMHKIMMEQVIEANKNIQSILNNAMVDCRRDVLWKRLLREGRDLDDGAKKKKDDSKDINLSFKEFSDLLKLVERRSLMELDPRLSMFSHLPVNWYQTLIKVLLTKYGDSHRQFISPDGAMPQYWVFLDSRLRNAFMLLSIDTHCNKAELGAVFREQYQSSPSMYTAMENVVNACCYHVWSAMIL